MNITKSQLFVFALEFMEAGIEEAEHLVHPRWRESARMAVLRNRG